jgi:hypothetical protein
LHRITSPRFAGSGQRFLDTFRQICGEHAFANVALVTTMWGFEDQGVGLRREFITKQDVVLKIQTELSVDHCHLDGTSVGADLASQLDKQLEHRRKRI